MAGTTGAGATTVAFELAAAVTAAGEWAAAVDLDAHPRGAGRLAAGEAGVALDRFAVVRRVPPARWATVVAALLDGVSLVLAEVPRGVRAGRRPPAGGARARARVGAWCSPSRAGRRGRRAPRSGLRAAGSAWDGPELRRRSARGRGSRCTWRVDGRGAVGAAQLARAG